MEVIDKWVTETFIRCQRNPSVFSTNMLSALKFGDFGDFLKLKISSALLEISDSLILENASAYCWTAAECTVRFMWPLSASKVSSLESVAWRSFLKRTAETNAEGDSDRNRGDPNAVDESTRRLESDIRRSGSSEGRKLSRPLKNIPGIINLSLSTMNTHQVPEYVETDPTGRYGRFEEVLGRGAMKTVYKAIDEMLGIEVAWSQVQLKEVLRSSVDIQRLYSEVHLLSTLNHKSIIRFYTSWIDVRSHTLNFITELFTSGTLRQYKNKYLRIDIRAIKSWARQILEGLVYLHGHDPPVIHRDLKCDNIFVNGHLGQMITSEFPYSECKNPAQIYKKVVAGKLPGAFYRVGDIEAQRFIGKCLVPASKRVSARELLQDPFLSSDESWMVYARGAVNLKPFLNENEMDRLKLEDDELGGRSRMTITGKLNAEDNTIFLNVLIADENGKAKRVSFPFDIMNDTSIDVAKEMVKELEITDWEPVQIAKMIDGEISSLVPGWRYEEEDAHDEANSQSSSNSGSYSNVNYISVDEHSSQPDAKTRTHNMTRFCPEERSHLHSGHDNVCAASSSSNWRLTSDNRALTRNRSLVDVQRKLLQRSLVEEARKRRLFKTVGDVENVGFQSPYAVSRKPRSSRR
ncbi:hypothetical protein BRARA_C01142 [Brassica rapa]|uniref:non-specific serine/threonine protein kinase n=1 Tax=Brassica campestris TaxID=3711 RepID=A0A398A061_BRACM|nr:hypothetical protein BRARA_C01142 [Brassica rapa]